MARALKDYRGTGWYPVPRWLHHTLTAVALLLWLAFAAWADLGGVVFLLGVGVLLWLRRLDYLGS